MWAIVGAGIQIILLLLTKWFQWDDKKKAEAKEILREAKSAKTASSVTSVFDKLNQL